MPSSSGASCGGLAAYKTVSLPKSILFLELTWKINASKIKSGMGLQRGHCRQQSVCRSSVRATAAARAAEPMRVAGPHSGRARQGIWPGVRGTNSNFQTNEYRTCNPAAGPAAETRCSTSWSIKTARNWRGRTYSPCPKTKKARFYKQPLHTEN